MLSTPSATVFRAVNRLGTRCTSSRIVRYGRSATKPSGSANADAIASASSKLK